MSAQQNNSIGVFDSGLGGLNVLKYFLKELPGYNYSYLGDNARLPYGEKSPETIYQYSREAVDHLFRSGCQLVIIACNTASALALRRLQQEHLPAAWPGRRVLGVIRPLVEYAAVRQKISGREKRSIGIMGTRATVRAGAYHSELEKLDPTLIVLEKAAPLLVPLIEEGWAKKPETKMILKKYLRPFKEKKIDTLILACTHYPYLLPQIRKIMGRRILIPEPGEIIAASLKEYLVRHPELDLAPTAQPLYQYAATDDNATFRRLGAEFLGRPLADLQLLTISS